MDRIDRAATAAAGGSRGNGVPSTGPQASQRGVALLLALAAAVALSLLALSVLASRELAVAVGGHGEARTRARRAAASGVEWALARAMVAGTAAHTATVAIGDGDEASVVIDASRSPHVVAEGRSGGATARLRADFEVVQPEAPPHAWVCLSSPSALQKDLTVHGSAHLNAAVLPFALLLSGKLCMHGDLKLVTTSTLGGSVIVHLSGATTRGAAAIASPTVALGEFPTVATGGVPVTNYSGSTSLADTTLTGIVRVSLAAGETMQLDRVVVSGTLVVDAPNAATNRAKLKLSSVTVQGGTSLTGNLAILAANATLEAASCTVTGVTMVHSIVDAANTTFSGQLATVAGVVAKSDGFVIARPVGFEPDTPLGLRWGTPRWRLRWLAER